MANKVALLLAVAFGMTFLVAGLRYLVEGAPVGPNAPKPLCGAGYVEICSLYQRPKCVCVHGY